MTLGQPHIAIFDSGSGGLSILQCLLDSIGFCHFSYYADDALLPYGHLGDEQVLMRVVDELSSHFEHNSPDLLVVACNTASTIVLPGLRSKLSIPVVGVVPAIKPAAMASRTKSICLLATPATIRRPYIDRLISDFARDCRVTRVAASDLVQLSEDYLQGEALNQSIIDYHIDNIFALDADTDCIVLGCTHFPLLRASLEESVSERGKSRVSLIDSGEAIATRVVNLLKVQGKTVYCSEPGIMGKVNLYHTKSKANDRIWLKKCHQALGSRWRGHRDVTVRHLSLQGGC